MAVLAILLFFDGVVLVWAFAEEPLGFRDPFGNYYDPMLGYPEISTIHDDITLALAVAAGFAVTDSQTIRIWDQLVDSEDLPGTTVSYTFGSDGFFAAPTAPDACPTIRKQVWPTNSFDAATSSVTSRFGPYSPFFHFPDRDGWEIRALHDWAWGNTQTLAGYEAYAWGKLDVWTAFEGMNPAVGCAITRTATISMPVQAGSLPAFATYLHSLADSYSHADCMAALDDWGSQSGNWPILWGTHTVTRAPANNPSIPACDYDPTNPTASDAHGEEFGSGAGITRTLDGINAVYDELARRSLMREGVYVPLPLTTTLVVSGTSTTLDGAIRHIVTTWSFDNPTARRAYADKLRQAIDALPARTLITRVALPLVRK